MKTEKIILYIILGLLTFNVLNKQCSMPKSTEIPKVSVVRDTIWQTKTDTFKIQTVKYNTVYVDTTDVSIIIDTNRETQIVPKGFIQSCTKFIPQSKLLITIPKITPISIPSIICQCNANFLIFIVICFTA